MKIETQTTEPLTRLGEALKSHRVAMLTLKDRDGDLHSRPMTPLEMDSQGGIWFMASRNTMVAALGGTGTTGVSVNLAFARHDESDYISIHGTARAVDDAQRKQQLWSAMARPWFEGPEDPDLILVEVKPVHAEVWDGPDSTAIRLLAMAASIVAGHEVGLGHKEEIRT